MIELSTILITVAIVVGIFLLCRELNCWYFKINERRDLLRDILETQEAILDLLEEQAPEKSKEQNPAKKKPTVKKTIPVVKVEDAE